MTANEIAFAGAVIAAVGAGIAIWQAWSARRSAKWSKEQAEASKAQAYHSATSASAAKDQATAAKEQVGAAKQQVALMEAANRVAEHANRLTEMALEEARDSRAVKVEVAVELKKEEDRWWIAVQFANKSNFTVTVREVTLVFADGTLLGNGMHWRGELEQMRIPGPDGSILPATLASGCSGSCHLAEYTTSGSGSSFVAHWNFHELKWRRIEGVRVTVNDKEFWDRSGDWKWMIQEQPFSLQPKGSV